MLYPLGLTQFTVVSGFCSEVKVSSDATNQFDILNVQIKMSCLIPTLSYLRMFWSPRFEKAKQPNLLNPEVILFMTVY